MNYHPLHPHQMREKSEGEPFECSGCKELGFGRRYQCVENCDFVLHEYCFKARPTDQPKTHPLMGGCRFQFLDAPPGGQYRRFCDACGRDVRGFLYHDIDKHKLDLHPSCMRLEKTMYDPSGRIVLTLKHKMPSKCFKCERKDIEEVKSEEPFRGWCYVSSCENYCYHVYCVKKLIYDNWERGYFNVASSSSTKSSSRGRSMSKDVSTGSSSRSTLKSGKGTSMSLKSSMSSTESSSKSTTRSGEVTSMLLKNSMSSTASSSKSTTRSVKGKTLLNTASSSAVRRSEHGVRSSITPSATSSLTVATRKKPSSFTRVLIEIAKIGFSAILSVLFGNPAPLFAALAENLLDN